MKKPLVVFATGLIVLLASLPGIGSVLANGEPHYYAYGYLPEWAQCVSGHNYVYDNDVYTGVVAEFVSVLFQEEPRKWIEVGWVEYAGENKAQFYVGWNIDETGFHIEYKGDVPYNTSHSYQIFKADGTWRVYIGSNLVKSLHTEWDDGVPQAVSETVDYASPPENELDGHFYSLKYCSGTDWLPWHDNITSSDPPYRVEKISHPEFYTYALMEGDTSVNDYVTIGDAMYIAQYLVDLRTLNAYQLECADTTDNGAVTIADAMHIAQWLVDPDGKLGVLFKPLWQSPADDDMLPPKEPDGGAKGQAAGRGTVISIPDANARYGFDVTVPIGINDVTDLGAVDIWLSYDSSVVEVADVADGTLGSLTYGIDNANGVTKMNWFSDTGASGDFTFANVTLCAVGNGGDTSPLTLAVKEIVDAGDNPISYSVDNGVFTVTPIVAETSLGQELEAPDDPSSVVLAPVNIDRVKDGISGQTIPDVRIDSYEAEASYLYDPPDGMEMLRVDPGDVPFDDPEFEIHNSQAGDDWTEFWQDPTGSAEAPLSVARLVTRLIGSAYDRHDLTANFDSMNATTGEEIAQESPAIKTYQRGDAYEDGEVTIGDAMWISQYLVGSRTLDEVAALNAASPHHNGDGGDKITIADAMYIAQFCAGTRDEYFNLVDGSKAGAFIPTTIREAVVEVASAKVPVGKAVLIPIIVKGVPADSAGLGCYDLKLIFNPKVVKVDDIKYDGITLAELTAIKIDNSRGIVLLNGFQSNMPGPVGDVILAYLAITGTGKPGDSTALNVEITTLADSVGNDIMAQGVDGVITIGTDSYDFKIEAS